MVPLLSGRMDRPGGDVLSHVVTFNSELMRHAQWRMRFAVDALWLFRAKSVRAQYQYTFTCVGQPSIASLNARGARWVGTALKNRTVASGGNQQWHRSPVKERRRSAVLLDGESNESVTFCQA